MTIQELYQKMEGNYDDLIDRLGSESLIDRFILKFPKDESMNRLDQAVAEGDVEQAFQMAHTIKGLSSNLSITQLTRATSDLTEQLRSRANPVDMDLYQKMKQEYDRVINVIRAYEAEK